VISLIDKSPKILVIGDLMIDVYLWGSSDRVSPEAPVQIVNVSNETSVLGGAGNVANNLNAFGAKVDIISVIGNCQVSKELQDLLSKVGINSKYILSEKGRIASKKTRIISSQQQVVRFDRESTDQINIASQNKIIEILKKIINNYDLVLLSDYGKGVLTYELTQSIISISNKLKKKVLVDPKGSNFSKYKDAYLLTPNFKEAALAVGNNSNLNQTIIKLKNDLNLDVSLITLSEQGIAIYDEEFRIHPTYTKEVYDVTGAGDTVLASLGFALACNFSIDDAIKFSNLAAGVVIGKIGSSTATLNEIIEYESSINKSSSEGHVKNLDEIIELVRDLKERKKRIIFTNGCFDLLHAGHVRYLEKAKNLGDILIIGLNSDKSVKLLKGNKRPINNQTDRALILAALEVVDFVVIFNEDTPYELIKKIKPHILVKGSDYKGKKVIGEEIVEELKLIDFVDGKSTTLTIEKIKEG
jgi:D-beta-D-heptose 7-phosphate kinase / D-beta-D-heptose 1-phosphate adenosyltransferase